MKKVFALVLILTVMFSVSAFAAPAKKVATVSTASQASGMKIGVGVYQGLAGMKFMGDSFNSVVGVFFSNTSTAGGSNSTFGVGGNFTFNLTGGAVPTHAGAGLTFTSLPANTTSFTLSAIYGAETTIADHLNIGFDIFPLSFTSTSFTGGSSTTFSILTGTVYAFYAF